MVRIKELSDLIFMNDQLNDEVEKLHICKCRDPWPMSDKCAIKTGLSEAKR